MDAGADADCMDGTYMRTKYTYSAWFSQTPFRSTIANTASVSLKDTNFFPFKVSYLVFTKTMKQSNTTIK